MKRHHHVLKSALRPEIKNRIKAASDPSWERPVSDKHYPLLFLELTLTGEYIGRHAADHH